MANNRVQVKRTSVSGRTPNTTGSYATNSQYISAGELALNMADGILYSSDGSSVIAIGANNTNVNVSNTLTANVINASTIQVGSSIVANTTRLVIGTSVGLQANGGIGSSGQLLTSNGSTVYWSTVSGGGGSVNTEAQYTWTNTQTFQNTITFSSLIDASSILVGGSSVLLFRVVDYTGVTTTLTINADTTDIATCSTSSTGTLTIANPTGTPVNGQRILIRVITTAAARTLSFGGQFVGSTDLPLPASTSNNLYDYFVIIWNSARTQWQIISRVQGY